MKKRYLIFTLSVAIALIIGSCGKSFLNVKPVGSLSQDILATKDGVNAMLVGCYSELDGKSATWGWGASAINWIYGDCRAAMASKGSDGADQPNINSIQTYSEIATNDYLNQQWKQLYDAIVRCNKTIVITNQALTAGAITQDEATGFLEQAKVLRGWYHYQAWRMWGGKIPYLDENADYKTVGNDADVRTQIIADLTEGTKLPVDMKQIGRFNKTVSEILLAQAMMQMNQDYAGALTLLTDAKTSGKKPNGGDIGLAPTFGEIFDCANRNGIESIYTVQYSVNDGSTGNNGGYDAVLNFPYKGGASPGGCCGFYCPTQEYVNSFRTSAGLPLLDFSYNTGTNPVKDDEGLAASAPFTPDAGPLDPRLDWSVGRRGIPYWDWGIMTGLDWIRDQSYSGPYCTKKQVYKKSQNGTMNDNGGWTGGFTANGYRMIRYADLLLLIAECQIETGDLPGAFANINAVRNRAANAAGFVMNLDGTAPAANYVINPYPSASAYPFDTKENAEIALRMERKLELGMEGHRWFDLNRWGITQTECNRILTYMKGLSYGPSLYGTSTAGANCNIYPIPQRQIDLSAGILVQNQ
jgi:starch-binding outer membrane protein, SusD/RagB family